ncbi:MULTISPECIES: hypothetical protein [Thalassospira]|uniref:Uncharacterized protein n=1 Tax=Thalassospira profundimaris TaxID=502049 RepID=A0A367V4M2_9PROT|nr:MULTISPECIES: hypothetical protein [Thalassospira]KZB73304.1 hypothetical protein AUQ43_18230 [Thalassospira sp. MCCC 1A01148]MBR9902341.1 hypothetical protein [Rhodospirillales bacterium]RCK20127.1 hypothetical protein TH6_16735 [Thalassospira profundimaris]
MSPVLAIYGKDHILGYVRGTLEDDEEKQDIESLVESDPRAAKIVRKLSEVDIDDQGTVDDSVRRRLEKLQNIATQAGIMV